MSTAPVPVPSDSVHDPMHPFGLPPGSVRGVMSLLICCFFWILLLWPGETVISPMLGHFFMLSLVLMAFASNPSSDDLQRSAVLPWLMRVLFVGGSLAVVALVLVQHPDRLQTRLTPDIAEFKKWWGPMLATMAIGFAVGLFIRFILGRKSYMFLTARAWLSVIGLLMLSLEIALYVIALSTNASQDWLAYFQVVELAVVSAYFGTRA